jgi:hypothetical protein
VVYTENNSLFGSDRRELASTLLGSAFDPSQGAQHHAATQLALWKLDFGDISNPSGDAFDVTARSFENLPCSALPSFDDNSAGVFALAQGWPDQLDGDAGNGEWTRLAGNRLSFVTGEGSQNLVTDTEPVPVPAAGGLRVGAIAGLAALRRRRAMAAAPKRPEYAGARTCFRVRRSARADALQPKPRQIAQHGRAPV